MPKFNEAQGAWEPEEHEIDGAAEQASLLRAFGKAPAQPAPQPNPILFHPDLVDREFGSHLIAVSKLTDWAAKRGLEVDTQPPIGGFQFVQVEAFLCAIERAARESTRDEQQAAAIIQATPHLAHDRAAEVAPRWLVGADAHMQWRRLLERAVEAGELVLLHFGSKLPIEAPTEPQTAPEVKEKPQDRRARWLVMFEAEEKRGNGPDNEPGSRRSGAQARCSPRVARRRVSCRAGPRVRAGSLRSGRRPSDHQASQALEKFSAGKSPLNWKGSEGVDADRKLSHFLV